MAKNYVTKATKQIKLKEEDFDAPELGGTVLLRQLTADEALEIADFEEEKKAEGLNSDKVAYLTSMKFISLSAVEPETNEKLFSLDEVRGFSIGLVTEMSIKAMTLSGMNQKTVAEAKDKLKKAQVENSPST